MPLFPILLLYIVIGVLAARGAIAISSRRFSARTEQTVYGLLLIPIAAMYLAFTAHFAVTEAWRTETVGVVLFATLGLVGIRFPAVLIIGYLGHGAWDLLHEVALYRGTAVSSLGPVTAIPLAYGAFCATFDWYMGGYFYIRMARWKAR
jgi:hypothetical protein